MCIHLHMLKTKPITITKKSENAVVLTLTHNLELFLLLDSLKHDFFILHFDKNSLFSSFIRYYSFNLFTISKDI